MNKVMMMFAAAALVVAGFAYQATRRSAAQENNNAPLMVAFADLKWTKLPERPGMMFAGLSGDPTKSEYTQMRKVPARNGQPVALT